MANDFLTVADMVADAYDLSGLETSEVRAAAPVVASLPAIPASNGIVHKQSVMTQLPVTGFRSENAGRDFDHSADRIDTVNLKILDWSWMVDKAVADSSRFGGGREQYIAREGMRHIQSAMFNLEQQWIYGTANNAAGFNGLLDSTHLDALADEMVVNAGGTTASTASSVFLIRRNSAECGLVFKGDGAVELGETQVQNFVDGSGKNYPTYYTPGCGWFAGFFGSLYSVARICNITEDSGKGLTDELIYKALERFPAGHSPDLMIMNRRSQFQLRASRTATSATGAPAPMVEEVAGVPVVTTDAILSTEALEV
tara:strand:- start:5350 stop:6288 length:939 start_codon:yes stop_codon:yes gene_type:complete